MEIRMRFPTVGQTAYISPRQGGSIGLGWSAFLAVEVLSMRHEGLCFVTVRDGSGRQREIGHFDLDCGREFKLPNGPWIHESDPRALRYVRKLLDIPSHENSTLERGHEDYQRTLKHILARNGWKEPTTVPA